MSLIFLSHSSQNNAEAVALRDWMIQQGWNEIFLDLDPECGLKAGERWQDALKRAAERCELVVFLVSPAWAASKWCLAEFLLAKSLNKRIFAAIVEPTSFDEMPVEMTAEWQVVDLTAGSCDQIFSVEPTPGDKTASVAFADDGLNRLRIGLKQAGLDPQYFEWPPADDLGRAPYPGLRPLEQEDAGIFFGREAPTVLVLDRLRGLREAAPPRLLVIQGASGAGKSSFLRAGLIPRLKRDSGHFLPLPIIRPENAVISGSTGLIQSIEAAFKAQGQPLNRAEIADAIKSAAQLISLLSRLADKARGPVLPGQVETPAPSLVLSIDQGEELFLAEGAEEAQIFLALLKDIALAPKPNVIILFTIRSDSYEQLQTAKALEGVRQETFSLPPMPRGAFQTIIEGPAQRLRATARKLEIEPALTARLLADIEDGGGKDALPLLAFTLERLYSQYGADGDLKLDEYLKLGGIAGSIEAAVGDALRNADANPKIPTDPSERLALLRRALIPALAIVDPETRTPRRRVARLSEIPQDAQGLIKCLVDVRLLATDQLMEKDRSETIVEPSHEALLRQWKVLNEWLKEDTAALLTLNGVQQAARDWEGHQQSNDWLAHAAGRLEDAEKLRAREDFAHFLAPLEQAYLQACRGDEDERRNRELDATRKIARRTRVGLAVASVLLVIAAGTALFAFDRSRAAEKQSSVARKNETVSLAAFSSVELGEGRPADAVKFALAAWPREGDDARPQVQLAIEALMSSLPEHHERHRVKGVFRSDGLWAGTDIKGRIAGWNPATEELLERFMRRDRVRSAVVSPDGKLAINMSGSVAQIREIRTGKRLTKFIGHEAEITSAAFSPNGAYVVTSSRDRTARIWDTQTGKILRRLNGHSGDINSAAFSPDGARIVTASWDKTACMWDVQTEDLLKVFKHGEVVTSAAFTSDGASVVTSAHERTNLAGFQDEINIARIWDAHTGIILLELTGHSGGILSAAFDLRGERLVTASQDGTARIWDVRSGAAITELKGKGAAVYSAFFSSDGARVVTASLDNTVRIWDANAGTVQQELRVQDHLTSAALGPNDTRLITAGGRSARIWDAKTGAILKELKGHTDDVWSAALSPDGASVATASSDKTARVWDAHTGAILQELKGHGDIVVAAAFNSDGTRVATASRDKTARIWDAQTGKTLSILKGHGAIVRSAAFSPDGSRVVTGSSDRSARIWDAQTGALLGEIKMHRDDITSAAFSPDQTRVVTASYDKTARIWDVSYLEKGDAFAVACARLGRNTDLTDLAKRYGLGELKPICGDHPPHAVDRSKVIE